MEDKIIAIYCFIDDVLKSMNHKEDKRRKVSESEILTTAVVAGKYFYGHQHRAILYMKSSGLIPSMLDKSRFNRRLHKVAALLHELFSVITHYIQYIRCDMQYIIDSFPVALCDNIRIQNSKIAKGNSWRGYTASMRRYFYGIKVQLIVNNKGIPVQFHFITGKTADGKHVEDILKHLQPEATV
ncbi:MAG: transposase [Arachidicoccus sp.]|nr:transposase [Arachidicoccus sp.]